MKINEVPQQPDQIQEGLKKVIYATNEHGELTAAQTTGWEIEIEVLKEAVNEIESLTAAALARGKAGQSSPLEYYMYLYRLDIAMLAQMMGKFQWQIKRHLKPAIFAKLSTKQLQQYAQALGIDSPTLQQLP